MKFNITGSTGNLNGIYPGTALVEFSFFLHFKSAIKVSGYSRYIANKSIFGIWREELRVAADIFKHRFHRPGLHIEFYIT